MLLQPPNQGVRVSRRRAAEKAQRGKLITGGLQLLAKSASGSIHRSSAVKTQERRRARRQPKKLSSVGSEIRNFTKKPGTTAAKRWSEGTRTTTSCSKARNDTSIAIDTPVETGRHDKEGLQKPFCPVLRGSFLWRGDVWRERGRRDSADSWRRRRDALATQFRLR